MSAVFAFNLSTQVRYRRRIVGVHFCSLDTSDHARQLLFELGFVRDLVLIECTLDLWQQIFVKEL